MDATTVSVRGFEIRFQTDLDTWMCQKSRGWAAKGQLPREWSELITRPDVTRAVCFPSYQRTWQSQRRQHVAEYTR